MADAGGGNIIFIRGLSEIITNKSTLLESLGPRLWSSACRRNMSYVVTHQSIYIVSCMTTAQSSGAIAQENI